MVCREPSCRWFDGHGAVGSRLVAEPSDVMTFDLVCKTDIGPVLW